MYSTLETKQSYFYDGSLLLAEKVGSQIQKIYINDGEGIIGMVRPIYNESNTLTHYQRLYYLYDSMGSVSAITGEHGLPLQNYTYSPYGTCLNVTGDPINNLQFVGRYGGYLDNDTGLTYFWHRWYDSRDGRWISRDPINVAGGINLYQYAGNEPNLLIDTNGMCWDPRSLVPSLTYGNYGGPGYTAGVWTKCSPPDWTTPGVSETDECYKKHDMCYKNSCDNKCKLYNCDMALQFCLWDAKRKDPWDWYYAWRAQVIFGIKMGLGAY